jgi:hypothetical protein
LDDGAALPNPFTLSVPRDEKPHRLRATAAGFSEQVEQVQFDADKQVVVRLSALANGLAPRSTQPKGAASVPDHPASSAARPFELPPVVKRPPRKLDSDNPFATP